MPAATPVTTRVADTVASALLLLLHVPPGVLLLTITVCPAQTLAGADISAAAFTVTDFEATQPVDVVKDIVARPPPLPVTIPVDATAAIDELLLLHVPPPGVLLP